ncbi:MAG: SURF1 family protein [Gemmatimonadales bacterium]
MSRLQTITFGIMILVVTAGCIGLGRWQLRRLADRRAANHATAEVRGMPTVVLNEDLPAQLEQRRVIAAGRYDHDRTIILRGRPYLGSPGVRVVTPLRLAEHDTAILVDRGFVPSADAVGVDRSALASPDTATVTGPAWPIRREPGAAKPVARDGATTWRLLEQTAVEDFLPYPVMPVVVLLAPGPAPTGYPRALEPPPLDDGPHLSYAIQWFAFATIGLVGGGILLHRRGNLGQHSNIT